MQTHLGTDMLQGFHLEVLRTRPALDGAERMLNGLATKSHNTWLLIEPLLQSLDNLFVFPAADMTFLSRRAVRF